MKTILLHIHDDDGSEARIRAALSLASRDNAQLVCLQVTPRSAYVSGDMFGNIYAAPDIMEAVNAYEAKLRDDTHARLAGEAIDWTYEQGDGDPARVIVQRARLIDLVVLGRSTAGSGRGDPLPLAGDVALHTRTPVLAISPSEKVFSPDGAALIAWNGGVEAANGLRAAMPMLRHASSIHVVTVGDREPNLSSSAACSYLVRHGLNAAPILRARHDHQIGEGKTARSHHPVGDALLDAANEFDAAYLVMGAYGHSRARETLLGGVTRDLLQRCPVPLLLAH